MMQFFQIFFNKILKIPCTRYIYISDGKGIFLARVHIKISRYPENFASKGLVIRKKSVSFVSRNINDSDMKYTETVLPGVWILEPKVFTDARGYFFEAYKRADFEQHIGAVDFVQENESRSSQGVLRGLHYQLAPFAQAKLVRVIEGEVIDVAVDIRRGSPTFGRHVSIELSGENKRQLFIAQGFAHGFYVKSATAVFTYMVDNPYTPSHERSIRFDDSALAIDLGINLKDAILSPKDAQAPLLADAEINFDF